MDMTNQLAISEIFGPTFQGEGAFMGQRCAFIRLAGCNLICNYCDTPYTWVYSPFLATKHRDGVVYKPAEQVTHISVVDVVKQLQALHVNSVVISGGEPLLQRSGLNLLLDNLLSPTNGWHVQIETNGTQMPLVSMPSRRLHYNVSPKLRFSGNVPLTTYLDSLQAFAAHNAIYKFVVRNVADLDEVAEAVALIGVGAERVWIMPEGTSPEVVLERQAAIADEVLTRGYNLSTRLHVLLWGDKRGK